MLKLLLSALFGATVAGVAIFGQTEFSLATEQPCAGIQTAAHDVAALDVAGGMPQLTHAGRSTEIHQLQYLLKNAQAAGRLTAASNESLQTLFKSLVVLDPVAALETIFVSSASRKRMIWRRLLDLWIQEQGVAVLEQIPAGWSSEHSELYLETWQAVAVRLPDQALPKIMALPPSSLRPRLMLNIAYALEDEGMAKFFSALESLTTEEQNQFADWDSIELAKKAPLQMLSWAQKLSEPQRGTAMQSALTGLAMVAPAQALERADSLSGSQRHKLIDTAIRKLAQQHLTRAVAEAETRGGYFTQVARIWLSIDPAAAIEWYLAHTPEQRNSSHDPLKSMARDWGRRDVDAALAYVEQLPEQLHGSWLVSVAGSLARTNPEQLRTLANGLPNTPHAAELYTSWTTHRYSSDPEGTLTFLRSLQPELRDKPLAYLVRHALDDTPEEAARIVEEIVDPTLRQDALRSLIRNWSQADDGRAAQWLAEEAGDVVRDEAYSILALNQPDLLPQIKRRDLRVASYLRSQHRPHSVAGLLTLLQEIGLSRAQWEKLDKAAGQNRPRN